MSVVLLNDAICWLNSSVSVCLCVCQLLAGCFVDVSSGVLMAGSRAVLSSDPDKPHQLWNITSDGLIRNNAAPNLVLEVKGQRVLNIHEEIKLN